MAENKVVNLKFDADKFIKLAQEYGLARKKNFKEDFNQADFIAGASLIFAMIDRMDLVPPMWVIGVMAGRDVFEEEKKLQPI